MLAFVSLVTTIDFHLFGRLVHCRSARWIVGMVVWESRQIVSCRLRNENGEDLKTTGLKNARHIKYILDNIYSLLRFGKCFFNFLQPKIIIFWPCNKIKIIITPIRCLYFAQPFSLSSTRIKVDNDRGFRIDVIVTYSKSMELFDSVFYTA
jgi:hypothetical protein